jgi:hypothetical protein
VAVVLPGLVACTLTTAGTAAPTWGVGPTQAAAGSGVRGQLAAALSARSLILSDAKVPFRPAEPPDLALVTRSVYQVQLRDDPSGGFIVAYDAGSPQLASAAGAALAAYLASGPGRVQSPVGTVHVIRQLGPTLLYYRWLPAAAPDPLTAGVQAALETLGTEVAVPL